MKIARNPTFTHPVKVSFPVDGGRKEEEFKARFKLLGAKEFDTFDLSTPEGTTKYLQTILVGWEGWLDDADQPVPVNDENRDLLIDTLPVRNALVASYATALMAARRGN